MQLQLVESFLVFLLISQQHEHYQYFVDDTKHHKRLNS
jgi:hypothetical protein